MTLTHLSDAALDAVKWTPAERIAYLREDRWICYTAAEAILTELDSLVDHPRNVRMPCRAIVGDADNGKTMLLRECIRRHDVRPAENDEFHLPVIFFETPSAPDEGRLYSQILKALMIAHREDAAPERLLAKVVDRFRELGVRMLMADEFHNMLNGSAAHQRQFLASLKSLINMMRVSFVAAGTHDVIRALATDSQFITRFEKLVLPKWGISNDARRLLGAIETSLPLAEASKLADDRELATAVILGGGGTIGGMSGILKRAAIRALEAGLEKITLDIVNGVVRDRRAREVAA